MNHNLTINQKKHQYPVFCCLRPIIDIIVQHVLPKILDIVVSFVLSLWYMNKLNGLYECSLGLVKGCRGFAPAEAWARLRVLQGGARDPQGLSQSALQVDRLLSDIYHSLFAKWPIQILSCLSVCMFVHTNIMSIYPFVITVSSPSAYFQDNNCWLYVRCLKKSWRSD